MKLNLNLKNKIKLQKYKMEALYFSAYIVTIAEKICSRGIGAHTVDFVTIDIIEYNSLAFVRCHHTERVDHEPNSCTHH